MSPHQVIAVAVRLFAVWLGLNVVVDFWSFYINATAQNGPDLGPVVVTATVFVLVFVLALWRFPLTVARKLLSSPERVPTSQASPDLWLAMGCSILGLWLLASTVPAVIQTLILHRDEFTHVGTGSWMAEWGYFLPKIVIGLWLILGARGFRKLFWWARNAGRRGPAGDTRSLPPE